MAKRIREETKEGVGVALERLAGSVWRGVGALFGFVVNLEKEGKSEYRECGGVEGKTASGKNIKGAYAFHVKVGLNPEDFKNQKKLDKL